MIDLIKSNVVFNEEDHTYFLGDKELFGITGMIGRQLFPGKYGKIPKHILEKAAAKGRFIHSQCQFVDETGLCTDCIEASNYLKERTSAGYVPLANEYLVSDNEYFATQIDNVWLKVDKIALCDIKTTYSLDKEYLSWQLSICAYLFELQNPLLKVDQLFGIWLRDEKSEVVVIERKPDSEVIRLLESEKRGQQFVASALVPANDNQIIAVQNLNSIIEVEEAIEALEKVRDGYRADLKKIMKEKGIKSCEVGRLKVSYTVASKQKKFDSKKFQADHPDLYSKYLTITNKSDSIQIKLKSDE
ncbi:hypothetical protein DW182_03055 [Bacteroides sp. AM16-24]|jgi:hypothetical protein|uniref:hypothetical protein n=1 Tax=Bacteroides sp. AM16-24 TaxID=2292002 RepID=UPI000E51C3E4|nr:hypothetical protein [Bacteroides sp. AM16-24]RHI11494.1 hypothetical protein DW182_03055 [Bacteroides sp. AM16-24]DAK76566.1 MAG TPA: hypothetical protein [Caudoviricetes sp.]